MCVIDAEVEKEMCASAIGIDTDGYETEMQIDTDRYR